MIVAVGIFAVVIIISVGAMLAISRAQLKVSNIQIIQDNLRFSLELMTKEMRTGISFLPSGGAPPAYDAVEFTHNRPGGGTETLSYCFLSGAIIRHVGNANQCADQGTAVTDPSLMVDQLTFYVIGQVSGADDGQPRVTISIRAHSADARLAASYTIQTTVTPRTRDF